MSPRLHEEYVALCALFYADEISDEEWALLQVHLAYCDSCRELFEQYKLVSREAIPAMAAAAAAGSGSIPYEPDASLSAAEQRLMDGLNSVSHTHAPRPSANAGRPWKPFAAALAACVLVAISAFAGALLVRRKIQPSTAASVPLSVAQPIVRQPIVADRDQAQALHQAQEEIAALRQQIAAGERHSAQAEADATTFKQHMQLEQMRQAQMTAERDGLRQQLAEVQGSVQDLRAELAVAQSSGDQPRARLTELEAQVRSLGSALQDANSALDAKDRMLSLDKDFLAHDRDIRDLIGARNLYIADIFDTNADGKTAKPFGRIFYTRDRSLVLYGFDLDQQRGLKQPAGFQVWGQSSDRQPVSLGMLYQDESHKHWVLRCNDSKTLARLNMVFVTVEPPGGSGKPTGKQLLRAYLQVQPNHP